MGVKFMESRYMIATVSSIAEIYPNKIQLFYS
ncbi:hypothetical protein SAMN05428947_103465 [Mucilaginibacter sp. OK283]|jgi:hypothetical protein|nr:hypothetical protein SAMN05428947_103465 [Mucilaginibacter sp. OK283]